MKFTSNFFLDFNEDVDKYYSLLSNEDFDFKSKNILIKISKKGTSVELYLECDSILDLKIATSAIIRSLEVIKKTLEL